ncbi:prolipoprotein diacylglyceryl transferase [Sunxiuqinia elliptica]|uniref:Phosphatidylglycerol--prolipoprotein diacylglyceryl transferase n=1 Tax=Sunxiuqinia elliptica TaxID=655355 RepID=A0A4R6HD26_9BACT|nr:prolipoprotein diacylglyceryl transferase [Sunxiuqinia elliptica]TDO05731.1 prolipoprotein diacylglyceryl transferase [Sunxiuqinia elliptica]TDO65273.1 prolipoprotein diacylglyceryl transferase [Sunxiuqinia elliptica]
MELSYIHWNPDPEIINVFGLSLRYYGLLFVTGLVLSLAVLRKLFRRENISADKLEKLSIYGFVGILAGARLGHCLFYEPAYYLAHPLEMILPLKFPEGGGIEFVGYRGLASHGGALGLIITLLVYARKTGESLIKTIDLIAVVAGLGAGFIRLANLMNSEIIGMPTQKTWGFVFERVDQLPRHPAQLYEALVYFLIFGMTLLLYYRKRAVLQNGFLFGWTLTLIFTARFFIEFIKERQVTFEEGMRLDMGQILSIPYILVGLGFMIYGWRKTRQLKALSSLV